MATLAKLVVKLITDATEFSSGMDAASKRLDKLGSQLTTIGTKMTLGVTVPLVAAGRKAVQYASDLEETRNKVGVVFGSMSEDVLKFADGSARSLGMSENAALDYASTYGSILKNMGLAEDQVADMSRSLVGLTADYASFHNLEPAEVFEKIKSGLVGASIPLIALGKDLRITEVQAYAMANGIGSANGELTNSELALARYGLLLAQSGDEIGDFTRTSDGLANSSRILKAEIENTMASFGEVLIPTVTTALQALIPILEWFNDLPKGVKQGIVVFLAFAAALGPVLTVVGTLLQLLASVAGLFGAKGALAGAGTFFIKMIGPGLITIFKGIGVGITGVSGPVLVLIAALIALGFVIVKFGPQAWETVKMLAQIGAVLGKQFLEKLKGAAKAVGEWLGNMIRNIGKAAPSFIAAGKQLMAGFVQGIRSFAAQLIEAVLKPVRYVIDQVKKMLGVASPSKVFAAIGQNIMAGLAQGIEGAALQPIQASVTAVDRTIPAVEGMRSTANGTREVHIGEIRIYGDLSDGAKKDLRIQMRGIAEQVFGEAVA